MRRNALQSVPLYLDQGAVASVLHRRPVLLLTTRARIWCKPRTTPLMYMPLRDRLVVDAGAPASEPTGAATCPPIPTWGSTWDSESV